MEFDHLKVFLAVAQSGTFSRAAIRLATTQPVLSRKVKALEDELGTELFHRTGRGVVLSEAGKLLEQYARDILRTSDGARQAVRALGTSPVGQVTCAMPPSLAAVLAVGLVREFQRAFPNVFLKVMEGHSGDVLEWLTSGKLDVAVVYDTPSLKGTAMRTDLVLRDELYLIGSAHDPAGIGNGTVPAARLADVPLVLPSRPHGIRVLVDDTLARLSLRPKVQLEVDAMHSLLALVEHGVGYGLLSYPSVMERVLARRLRIWRIVEPTISRSLRLAVNTQRPATRPVRGLARIFREQVAAHVRNGHWTPQPETEGAEAAPVRLVA